MITPHNNVRQFGVAYGATVSCPRSTPIIGTRLVADALYGDPQGAQYDVFVQGSTEAWRLYRCTWQASEQAFYVQDTLSSQGAIIDGTQVVVSLPLTTGLIIAAREHQYRTRTFSRDLFVSQADSGSYFRLDPTTPLGRHLKLTLRLDIDPPFAISLLAPKSSLRDGAVAGLSIHIADGAYARINDTSASSFANSIYVPHDEALPLELHAVARNRFYMFG